MKELGLLLFFSFICLGLFHTFIQDSVIVWIDMLEFRRDPWFSLADVHALGKCSSSLSPDSLAALYGGLVPLN